MKEMPLPFGFEGKGVLDLELLVNNSLISSYWNNNNNNSNGQNFLNTHNLKDSCFFDCNNTNISTPNTNSEPASVLDTKRSPSPPTSSSTLSSSLGGGGGSGGAGAVSAGVAAISGGNHPSSRWQQENPNTANTTPTTSSNVGGAESELQPVPPSLDIGAATAAGAATEKCTMEEWESVLSDSVAASPSQEQSILRWIMGDVDDPSMTNLNKALQIGAPGVSAPPPDYEFNAGFGTVVDQGFGGLDQVSAQVPSCGGNFLSSVSPSMSNFPGNKVVNIGMNLPIHKLSTPQNPFFPSLANSIGPIGLDQAQQPAPFECVDTKPPIFNPQLLINQHQAQQPQNPSFFLPLHYAQQDQNLIIPPQAKRHNPGSMGGLEPGCQIPNKGPFSDTGQELFMGRNQQQQTLQQHGLPHQLQLLPHYLQQQQQQQRPTTSPKPKMVGDEMGHCNQQQQLQQAIIDQLYKAAELVHTGNPVLAQGILARLNHQLSPIGKPFQRAAFYCKEALQQLLLHANNNNNSMNPSTATSPHSSSPFNLIFKIGAYKSFSEISPIVQFANFTCNQALLEVLEGFDRIHIIDFDIGYGGQWASLMQELALRNGGAPALKITAFASPSTHDQLELGLTRENLIHFASEINMVLEFEMVSIESLSSSSWSLPLHVSDNEAIAVNLPVASFSSLQLSLPLVLRFVKQLSPKIVVSVDRGCDRTDIPFPNHVIHALQSYSNLLESLDAVNVNLDALQKIERFLLQPGIEKIVMGRYRSPEKTQHWRTLFLSAGFSPITFSNFTESQAECVVKRTPVRGFHVEKRQSSLVLCWQRKELISASAWRC